MMALVNYSDSEGSASDEDISKDQNPVESVNSAGSQPQPGFSVNKSNPRKIQVKLTSATSSQAIHDDEPPAKKPRLGAAAIHGFNAMLPPPKRDSLASNETANGVKKGRRIFSLRTSAEPAFSRESYIRPEEWDQNDKTENDAAEKFESGVGLHPPNNGNAMIFKPLSVSRKPQKKKPNVPTPALSPSQNECQEAKIEAIKMTKENTTTRTPLFSSFSEAQEDHSDVVDGDSASMSAAPDSDISLATASGIIHYSDIHTKSQSTSGSLEQVAMDLKLSAADRRQLFGRDGKVSADAINVVNFNTDTEYAANEEIRASGEQVQHNPVRAIAPGKHSLKQLVSAASGQKEALEESFAAGKRNKKEAGSRYGW